MKVTREGQQLPTDKGKGKNLNHLQPPPKKITFLQLVSDLIVENVIGMRFWS